MSTENPKTKQQNESDFQSCGSDQSFTIVQEIEDAIKELPSLDLKIQAIAINNYILQKRQLDEKKQLQIDKIQFKIRNSCNNQIDEIYTIIDDGNNISQEDYSFILDQKHLLTQVEAGIVDKIVKGQQQKIKYDGQIAQYWLKCLLHSDIITEQIQGQDQQVLKYLYRIEANRNEDNTKLTVSFFFKPNKWFHNEKITKNFKINKKGEEECQKSDGDEIEWKEGMNYTVTVLKKKKKGKKPAKEQKIKQPSFFHFFTSISSISQQNNANLDEDAWDDLMQDLELQYQLAVHIYEDLIPKSLQFFLGCNYTDDVLLEKAPKINETILEKQEDNDSNND